MSRFKGVIKNLLMALVYVLPFHLLRHMSARKLLIVNYHSIQGWDPDPVINANTYRTIKQLASDLQFFKKHYSIIGIQELLKYQTDGVALAKNALLITIDDGLKAVYDLMYPVFKSEGLSACIFLNSSFVDNKDLHFLRKRNLLLQQLPTITPEQRKAVQSILMLKNDENIESTLRYMSYSQRILLDGIAKVLNIDFTSYLEKNQLYLSSVEIQEMKSEGFTFGAHSKDHPPFDELDLEEQDEQVEKSCDVVEKNYALNYMVFAFPSNDKNISTTLFEKLNNRVDLSFGVQGMKSDQVYNHYHRIEIEASGKGAGQALKYEYVRFLIFRLLGNTIVKRKD